jgi:hypothetical protein
MNPFRIISAVLLSLLIFSCNKQDEQAAGVGDAIMVVKKSGTTDVYGISLYAYTYSSFKSVTAKLVNGVIADHLYTLKVNQGYKTNFYYETPDAEYTTTKPVESTLNFSAVFENGTTDEFQDELSNKVLATAVIDTCQYNSTKHVLRLIWKPVIGAESYAINIMNDSTLIFGSPQLSTTVNAVYISANSIGWATGFTPTAGNTYKVKVFAYLYEATKSPYDIQCVSIAEADAVWGE